jgi:hypothetical protein
MKLFLLMYILLYINCNYTTHSNPREERILIEIDERTDSLSKFIYPTKTNPHKMTVKMFGVWNDTVIIMNTLLAKDSINNTSTQEYSLGGPGTHWNFKKYKATKYRIRLEVIYSEDFFEGYQKN